MTHEQTLQPILRVRHSLHEEYIAAEMQLPDRRLVDLGARAHHHLLLELARARLEDRKMGIPPGEQGWLHRGDLEARLGLNSSHINVLIFRLRRQLVQMQVPNAAEIIERRCGIGELRLGTGSISLSKFDD